MSVGDFTAGTSSARTARGRTSRPPRKGPSASRRASGRLHRSGRGSPCRSTRDPQRTGLDCTRRLGPCPVASADRRRGERRMPHSPRTRRPSATSRGARTRRSPATSEAAGSRSPAAARPARSAEGSPLRRRRSRPRLPAPSPDVRTRRGTRRRALPGGRSTCARRAKRATSPRLPSRDFEETRSAHAAADAHRDHDVLHSASLSLDERVTDHAGTGRDLLQPATLRPESRAQRGMALDYFLQRAPQSRNIHLG